MGLLTDTPGASSVIKDSFVTYSNEAKVELGVPQDVIDRHTVYSSETALAMAHAGLSRSVRADVGVGITGSLSRVDPENEAASTPGEVYLGIVFDGREIDRKLMIHERHRPVAKLAIAAAAIREIRELLDGSPS